MATEIKVPTLGESVTEATVSKWFKEVGDPVTADEPLLELETDKVTLEVNAPVSGALADIAVEAGSDVEVGALLGTIAEGAAASKGTKAAAAKAPAPAKAESAKAEPQPAPPAAAAPLAPAVRKLIDENDLDAAAIPATGKDGRLTKGDVLAYLDKHKEAPAEKSTPPA
ncbi:MAG: biotin/lipoyl-containing protein, partial [Rhodospirillales bacterium]|nr:biotin/lipoyl-containing protein [Rhodospirillales bacterium]